MVELQLENDLLPLSLAALLAYSDLTEVKGRMGSEEHLRDVVDLAVAALLHVAPIYRSADGGRYASVINAAETKNLLFAPIREGREALDLDGFYIRRSDLHAAIAKLRSASGSRSAENG